mmetsp:Transcript_10032/g.24098  ORF Transcript_10032/g.24098 Transcript_10032/m.24098 type:complete len:264 (+) Transcript_10032:630-1421(+)
MCMHPGCSATLPDSQVKKLTPSIYQRYIQNKFMDYEKRVLDLFLFDDDFAAWARANTQSCPRCHVLVQRSDGCNHMRCQCGHQFCYRCGRPYSADCNCAYAADGPEFISGRPDELGGIQPRANRIRKAAGVIKRAFMSSKAKRRIVAKPLTATGAASRIQHCFRQRAHVRVVAPALGACSDQRSDLAHMDAQTVDSGIRDTSAAMEETSSDTPTSSSGTTTLAPFNQVQSMLTVLTGLEHSIDREEGRNGAGAMVHYYGNADA